MIVIKRYPNRRLYDTQLSSYVTLDDVAARVRAGESFQVVDARSGEDLTRRVLTQVVLEQARQGDSGTPIEFLRHLILASDPEMREFLSWYLGQALEAYHRMKDDWRAAGERGGIEVPPAPTPPKAGDGSSSIVDEMKELRRRMEEMERRLHDPDPSA